MKNLILNLEGVQVLSRNEQKNVNGGLAAPGSCNALITSSGGSALLADVTYADVQEAIKKGTDSGYRVQWCCASCATASWL